MRQFGVEKQLLARRGVYKSQCLGVQSLPWTHLEAVADKLFVLRRSFAEEYLVAAVTFVVE